MFLGIDLGGTNIAVGVTDEEGRILAKHSRPTGVGRTSDELLLDMKNACLAACQQAKTKPADICSVGVGVPGTIDKKSLTLVFGPNLFLQNVCFREAFLPEFSCPVYLENDANCAALGEYYAGAGRGVQNLVMVTLGTGIGGGIVIGGEIYSGFNDIAGEIGHMVIAVDGALCNCGRKGCWEAYASASALIRMAREAMECHPKSLMHTIAAENGGKVSALTVFSARDKGDAAAVDIVENYIKYLACGINNIISILQPEKLILGGGVAGQGEKLLAPLRARVNAELLKSCCAQTEIVLAQAGNDAGIIGAAMLKK